jgi:hypothetical protein
VTAKAQRVIRPATREHAAAVHLLAAPFIWDRAARYVGDRGQVDWPALERAAGVWSSSEWLLVQAAHDLYNGGQSTSLHQACATLDTPHLRRVLEAVCILRPDVVPPGGWSR